MAPTSGSAELLAALRASMAAQGLAALVVPSEGACVWMLHVWVWVWVVGVWGCEVCYTVDQQETKKSRSLNTRTHKHADAHQSEYTPERDRRRQYVSGFTGSAGTGG